MDYGTLSKIERAILWRLADAALFARTLSTSDLLDSLIKLDLCSSSHRPVVKAQVEHLVELSLVRMVGTGRSALFAFNSEEYKAKLAKEVEEKIAFEESKTLELAACQELATLLAINPNLLEFRAWNHEVRINLLPSELLAICRELTASLGMGRKKAKA